MQSNNFKQIHIFSSWLDFSWFDIIPDQEAHEKKSKQLVFEVFNV